MEPAHTILKAPVSLTSPNQNFHVPHLTHLSKLLNARLQLRLMQRIIIHCSQPHHVHAWKASRDAIHQDTTGTAEVVLHCIACGDGVVLGEFGQVVLAADVLRGVLFDDEVGAECRC